MNGNTRPAVDDRQLAIIVHLRKIHSRAGLRRAWLRLSEADRASVRWSAGLANHAAVVLRSGR